MKHVGDLIGVFGKALEEVEVVRVGDESADLEERLLVGGVHFVGEHLLRALVSSLLFRAVTFVIDWR